MIPPWLRKMSMARATGLRYGWFDSDTKHRHKTDCGGILCHAKRSLSDSAVADNVFWYLGNTEKPMKIGCIHHLRVAGGEPAEFSTSLGQETPSRPRSELKVGRQSMPAFFCFYPVNRSVFAFLPPRPRSLFLRFSAGSG